MFASGCGLVLGLSDKSFDATGAGGASASTAIDAVSMSSASTGCVEKPDLDASVANVAWVTGMFAQSINVGGIARGNCGVFG